MRPGLSKLVATCAVGSTVWAACALSQPSRADEPRGPLGRLFRFGSSSSSANSRDRDAAPAPAASQPAFTAGATNGAAPSLLPPPSTPSFGGSSEGLPRLFPQPRVSRPATESDPILTRAAIGRTSDGGQFVDFMQVFADGTVLDGSGVHHVDRATLKPLIEAIQNTDLFRLHGHCGGPAADFPEQVHIVVYERNLGRLRANSFSFSGNTQGCDHAVNHIQKAIESIQTKLSGPAVTMPATAPTSALDQPPPVTPPSSAPVQGRTIPLTPLE